ncbi:MAG: hypothetical protein ACJ77Z_10360 [Thermoleophilaceae bacterium]
MIADAGRVAAFRPGIRASSGAMIVRAKLFCTDPACDAVYEAIGRLEELETLACFCGGGLEIAGFPDHSSADRGGFELLPLAA